MPQPKVRIGRRTAPVEVDRLAFGTAPLATIFWGNDESTAIDAVGRALALGITFFDTAPFYGLGESERRLGAALERGCAGVVIATKVGRLLVETPGGLEARFDFSYEATRRSLESSLDRLGMDRIDIVHIHDPDDHIDEALAGAHRALVDLRDQGVITAVSLGTNSVSVATRFIDDADLDCVLVAGRYTLLDQSASSLLERCARRGVRYLAAGVFNSGVLARLSESAWFDYAPVSRPVLARARAIDAVCRDHHVPLRTAALRFPLTHPAVDVVVAGMAAASEVEENLAALGATVPMDLWADLTAQGLLDTGPPADPRPNPRGAR